MTGESTNEERERELKWLPPFSSHSSYWEFSVHAAVSPETVEMEAQNQKQHRAVQWLSCDPQLGKVFLLFHRLNTQPVQKNAAEPNKIRFRRKEWKTATLNTSVSRTLEQSKVWKYFQLNLVAFYFYTFEWNKWNGEKLQSHSVTLG